MLNELSKVEQRYDAVLAVQRDGFSVTEVAKAFGVGRQQVHVCRSCSVVNQPTLFTGTPPTDLATVLEKSRSARLPSDLGPRQSSCGTGEKTAPKYHARVVEARDVLKSVSTRTGKRWGLGWTADTSSHPVGRGRSSVVRAGDS